MLSLKKLCILLFYAICGILLAVLIFMHQDAHILHHLEERTYFNAPIFVQARVLSPAVAYILNTIAGGGVHHLLLVHTVLASIAAFISIWLFAYYISDFIPKHVAFLVAPLIIVPCLWNYCVLCCTFNPDDIPSIAFFSAGLLLINRDKRFLFYLTYFLGILNRETVILLSMAFLITFYNRMKIFHLLLNLVAQLAMFLSIRWLLFTIFRGNPNTGVFENCLLSNFEFLHQLISFNTRALAMLMVFSGVWLFIPVYWKYVPIYLRRTLLLLFPFLAAMLLAGNLNHEARIFSEMIPVIYTPFIVGLYRYITDEYAIL